MSTSLRGPRRAVLPLALCVLLLAPSLLAGGASASTSPPDVRVSPGIVSVGQKAAMLVADAAATDNVTWRFGDGVVAWGKFQNKSYAYPGDYLVHVTVRDGAGAERTTLTRPAFVRVLPLHVPLGAVTNATPPLLTVAASAQLARVGQNVTFTATGSGAWVPNPAFDPEDPVRTPLRNPPLVPTGAVALSWDFKDGTGTATGPVVTHAFPRPGLFPVRVTATAESGATASFVVTVNATRDAAPPLLTRNPGAVVVATLGHPQSLDPAVAYESSSGTVVQQTYETLYGYLGSNGAAIAPRLARALPAYSENNTTLTIPLRTGIWFHDGTRLDAHDVKFSLDRAVLMNDPDGPAWVLGTLRGAEEYVMGPGTAEDRAAYLAAGAVEVVDNATVRIRLARPDAAALHKLASTVASIVSKDAACAHAGAGYVDCIPPPGETRDPWMDAHEAGTGPYRLLAWYPNHGVLLGKFDAYWSTKANVPRAFLQTVDDADARLLMLRSGQADSAFVGNDRLAEARGVPGARVAENASFTIAFLGFNQAHCGRPGDGLYDYCMANYAHLAPRDAAGEPAFDLFGDVHMRKAWTLAFDHAAYRAEALGGQGRALNGLVPAGMFGHDARLPAFKQDLARAASEMQLAKHSDGFQATLHYNTGNTLREATARLYAEDLEEMCRLAGASCDVEVVGLDWSTAYLPMMRARALSLVFLGWAPDYAHPSDYLPIFAHSQHGAYATRVSYANPVLDGKLDKLVAQTNATRERADWSHATRLLNEDAAFLPLHQAVDAHVERDWMRGYVHNPTDQGGPLYGRLAPLWKA